MGFLSFHLVWLLAYSRKLDPAPTKNVSWDWISRQLDYYKKIIYWISRRLHYHKKRNIYWISRQLDCHKKKIYLEPSIALSIIIF